MSTTLTRDKIKLFYKEGPYPTTMQMYYDKYNKEMYDEIYQTYLKRYYSEKYQDEKLDYEYDPDDKFYVNFDAFLILSKHNKVKAYAFDDFNNFAWITKVISIDGLKIYMDKVVFDEIRKDEHNLICFRVEE